MRYNKLPPGLYDLLKTPALMMRIEDAGLAERASWKNLAQEEIPDRVARLIARELSGLLSDIFEQFPANKWQDALESVLRSPEILNDFLPIIFPNSAEILQRISPSGPSIAPSRPDTPLSVSALLTGSSRSPALRTQLQKELTSADRADWLVSFIKYAGIVPLMETLRNFTLKPASDGGPRLRIATTSYMGATDVKAIEELLKLPNTEIRVSYDTKRTRLHAKAYLFHRTTGFSSAYIGSANVSKAALDEGLEWTAKISQYETEHLWRHAVATFESHWEDTTEFSPCTQEDLPVLRQALSKEQGKQVDSADYSFFDLRPYEFQKAILEDITNERNAGKNKHLVIAATGTGKTMIAAFDYKRLSSAHQGLPTLLFVAHREEILKQARAAFRQVLRDGSFGELVVGGTELTQYNYLFCTVQSWNSRDFSKFTSEHFEYVILDEAHHASATSYQTLISHINPRVLLGLTATPERSDGGDIRDDFGGAFTHEIRLPEAVDRALLCPFHYFGIPDLDGLDFSTVAWIRGGYDVSQLAAQVEGNMARASWVISQAEKFLSDLTQVRGLGFCISVRHAEFMAQFCTGRGIPSIALTADSPRDQRLQAQRKLVSREIRFIFTVDLYNEGVDIPCVDTVLFLRPTECLTLFLQQLGRGLRLHDEKPHLTVLDFIAPQHRQFRFGKRFQSLSTRPDIRIDRQVENDMPYIPAGCLLHLERQAKEYVLKNINEAMANLRGQRFLEELRLLRNSVTGELPLEKILDFLHMDDPDELYKRGLPHLLLSEVLGQPADNQINCFAAPLADGFRRLNQMDDVHLLADMQQLINTGNAKDNLTPALLNTLLWKNNKPENGSLTAVQKFLLSRSGLKHDLTELLDWLLQHRTPIPATHFEQTGPLTLHASYTRKQILLALGLGKFESPYNSREGVLHVPARNADVFFADINKTESDFSPTTMYDDYAITDRRFHWQSQSTTGVDTSTGIRYLQHEQMGYTPLLFIRERKKQANDLTAPYFFVGPLHYRHHEGTKPISITWELEHPLPARVLPWARRVS